jgi:probable F420-dependent oxidoreductase
MKIGVNLINFGPAASLESMTRWAKMSESLGYHLIMAADHVAITPDVQNRYPAPFYEPFTTLGWLAGMSLNIELGTTVIILPYRSPIEVARMTAMIDNMSGGRFILGVGVGWAQQEFEALGVPFHKRGAITNDYLAAIRKLWTNKVASHQGPYAKFENVYTEPLPLSKPHPPVWVGGASDAALRRAVKLAEGWHPIRPKVSWLRDDGLPRLKRIAQEESKPVPALCPRIRLRITESDIPEDARIAGEGSLDQIRRDMAALEQMGAQYVLLDTYRDDLEETKNHEYAFRMLSTMAEKVLDLPRQSLR